MLRDMYAACLEILDASSLPMDDRTLWASVLMRNPVVVQAYFVQVFSSAPQLLVAATTGLRLNMHASEDPEAMKALMAHERTILAGGERQTDHA